MIPVHVEVGRNIKSVVENKNFLEISKNISIPFNEIEFSPTRSQGAGGQHVNKVSTAIHLRFNINTSSLPDIYKQKLLNHNDSRISKEGIIIIKSRQFRSQKKNKDVALQRLQKLIKSTISIRKKRKSTQPTESSQKVRLDSKAKRGKIKKLRKKIIE